MAGISIKYFRRIYNARTSLFLEEVITPDSSEQRLDGLLERRDSDICSGKPLCEANTTVLCMARTRVRMGLRAK